MENDNKSLRNLVIQFVIEGPRVVLSHWSGPMQTTNWAIRYYTEVRKHFSQYEYSTNEVDGAIKRLQKEYKNNFTVVNFGEFKTIEIRDTTKVLLLD